MIYNKLIELKLNFIFILITSLFLISCGSIKKFSSLIKKEQAPPQKDLELFKSLRKAEKYFNKGQYELAYEYYEEIKNKYPGTPQAILAQLRMADCKYWAGEYLEAISLYKEFEKFYPTNEAIPYVIFQIGTCYYKLKLPYDRDQTYTKKAIYTYERLLKNYPNSPYNIEAKKRIKELKELLAKHELYVAKFYYKIKYYRSAYRRLLYLIENYPNTHSAKYAQRLLPIYERKAKIETKELKEGKKKDFWGQPVP